jgi:hypothetical protein
MVKAIAAGDTATVGTSTQKKSKNIVKEFRKSLVKI